MTQDNLDGDDQLVDEKNDFRNLIARVRAGDGEAAETLVKKYEPAIRRAIRFRMSDTRLGAAFDSMDVCQSVLGSFFLRASSGQFDLHEPAQLTGLLVTMAKKKLAAKVRYERAGKRDNRLRADGDFAELNLAGAAATPSRILSTQEILDHAQQAFSAEERQLIQLRNDGLSWSEIAQQVGGTVESLRKRLARALDRVSNELGIEEDV